MADKIVRATVTGPLPVYINGVLHLPGEDASVNLDQLGVSKVGVMVERMDESGRKVKVNKTPGLEAKSAKADEEVEEVQIAAVAPHAPGAPNPQGLATGTRQSGTGRLIGPHVADE